MSAPFPLPSWLPPSGFRGAGDDAGWVGRHGDGTFDLMYWINFWAVPPVAAYLVLTGEAAAVLALAREDVQAMVWLSLAGALLRF
jgi:hypothetical protein